MVSLFLLRCAANMSHAFAITSKARLLSGSLKVLASSRHFSAFSRYHASRPSSATSSSPPCQKTHLAHLTAHRLSLFPSCSIMGLKVEQTGANPFATSQDCQSISAVRGKARTSHAHRVRRDLFRDSTK